MLTQCPECETVFRVSAAQLQAAAGRVRCGQCNTVFHALEAPEEAAPAVEEEIEWVDDNDSIEVEQVDLAAIGTLTTSTRLSTLDPGDDPLADTAEHEILNVEIESTPSIEITMEGERIDIDGEQFITEAEEFAEQVRGELADLHAEFKRLAATDLATTEEEERAADPPQPLAPAHPQGPQEEEFFLPSGTRAMLGDALQTEALPSMLVRKPRRRLTLMWAIGSALVALALIAQLVHFNRDALARNTVVGEPLMRIYNLLGLELSPAWDLHAYELRQWGATADPQAGGALRVRASLFNNGEFAQPYPLLRLTLQDRFGGQVGGRDLTPKEYLPEARPGQMLAPGQRIDAEIALVDPGKDAVGFEIDVCLRASRHSSDHKVVCANDPKR